MKSHTFAMVCIIVVGFASYSECREFRVWTYKELQETADLVVISHPSNVRLLNEKFDLPNIFTQSSSGKKTPYHALGVETEFDVLATLKGADRKNLVLHHYRSNVGNIEINGPLLMKLDPQACEKFLMFLKKRDDGQ
jgi:hypothetical protein